MRFEFLPHVIALALQRFAMRGVDPVEVEQQVFECLDGRFRRIEVARLAGAKIAVVASIGERRGPPVLLDQADQSGTQVEGDEIAQLEQLDLVARHALHALARQQHLARRFARSRHHFYDSARATRFNRERKLRTAAAVAIFASLFGFIVQQARAVAQAA